MKICPQCARENAATAAFCESCGKPLTLLPQSLSQDPTVRYVGPLLGAMGEPRRTTALESLFAGKTSLRIGRSADCDVCLSHPMISRHHALFQRQVDGRLLITDLESINGVTVNGERIGEPTIVRDNVSIGIGPFLFTTHGGQLNTVDSSRSVRLEARHLAKAVPIKGGAKCLLLDDINLAIEPGEFVSLLGPSGSGKSTLMDCLNGRRWATSGQVLANGEDFYRFFDSFRQSLGYVPQKDIVHTQLSVFRALYYTARLRLPPDTSYSELAGRIEEVVQVMELGPHRDTLVANLSGGQIKRVSLAAELLARPCLLYIDEATSGLDAGTEARMMRLFRQLADEGKSLICITHNVDNVDRCHLVLVLARGKLIYYGPPREAPPYFQVKRISEIYDRIAERDLAQWQEQFQRSELYQEFVLKRLGTPEMPAEGEFSGGLTVTADPPGGKAGVLAPVDKPWRGRSQRPPRWHQFRVLTSRYAELLWGDKRSFRLLMLQAPAVAVILLIGFINKPFEGTLPRLRHLTDQEQNVLLVLKGIEQDLAKDDKAVAAKGDTEATFSIQRLGVKKKVTAAELRQKLKELEASPPNSIQRKALEEIKIEVTSGEAKLPIDLKQAGDLQKLLVQSKLSTKLLETDKVMPVVPEEQMVDPRYTYMMRFMVVIIVLWFGCNNAAKEIVKEEAIYGRERAVNLGILPYVSSKFLLLSLITAAQALLLMVILYGALEVLHQYNPNYQVPPEQYQLSYAAQFGVLILLSMTGVGLGLLLSACVATPDRANALLPYVLIPQIILGGGIMPVIDGVLYLLAVVLSPVYWAFRAVRRGTHDLPDYSGYQTDYSDDPLLAGSVLVVQLMVLLILTAWFLRRKDVQRL
jgi:ABC-type multidrug transport system ATPase subunit